MERKRGREEEQPVEEEEEEEQEEEEEAPVGQRLEEERYDYDAPQYANDEHDSESSASEDEELEDMMRQWIIADRQRAQQSIADYDARPLEGKSKYGNVSSFSRFNNEYNYF